jgi:hypothetical protein
MSGGSQDGGRQRGWRFRVPSSYVTKRLAAPLRLPTEGFTDDKSLGHDFLNVPVRMPDEEGRCGIGNERQVPVRLRFSLYQEANLPVLRWNSTGASYRGCAEQRRSH